MKRELSEAAFIRAIQKRSRTGVENPFDRYLKMLVKLISCAVNNPALFEVALERTLYTIQDFDAHIGTSLIWTTGVDRSQSKSDTLFLTKKNHPGNAGPVGQLKCWFLLIC